MSTKCTIYFQAGKRFDGQGEDNDYIHIYWDMGGHQPRGLYVEAGNDPVLITNPAKLIESLKKLKTDDIPVP